MQEPKVFLPKKGNYQDLASYKKATVIYDLTFYFAKRFLDKGDRTIDQMVQAARSGKQNIAEGCAAAATSAETELKLVNVARASMKELLVDYEDYLRVRRLTKWAFDDERTRKTREFCKTHESSDDFMRGIDKRSDEAIANITITLLHQFDNIIGAYIAHLEKTFVEQGGIRERMTAARLGYRNDQKTCIAELEAENSRLKARIAELEEKLKGLSPMSLTGLISLIGHIGQGLISLMILGLASCSGSSDDDLQESQPETNSDMVAITFNGSGGAETAVTRADGMPLSEKAISFTVWGYKNMSYAAGDDDVTQCVFPSYVVNWTSNSAGTTTSNSSGWEYVAQTPNQTIKFWDWSAKAYRFFAVTEWTGLTPPETIGGYGANMAYGAYETYKTDGADETYGDYKVSMLADASSTTSTPYFSHLWFSTGDPVTYADKQFGKPVTLEFLQPFTRVRFIFKYVFPREGIKLTGQSFKPTDGSSIVRKGIVTVSYPLEGPKTEEWFEMTKDTDTDPDPHLEKFTEDYDPEDDTKVYTETAKGWYTVLPNLSQGSYTLTVTINGAEKTAVVPANYMQWLPGYSYTYVFKITDEGGVVIGWVESAVTPWTEMEADRTVYNW